MSYDRNVKILVWQGFFIGFSLWVPIAAIYFSKVAGSFALGMSIFAIANISGAVFELPTGVFSDRIGRKYTTMLGGLSYTISAIMYAIGLNYWWLVAGAMMGGLGRSFYSGNNDALLYDSLNRSNKKIDLEKFMGYVSGAEQWALSLSAIVGGVLAAYSFSLVMWLSVIPLFLCFVTSWWLTEVAQENQETTSNVYSHLSEAIKNFVSNKKLRLLSLSSVIGFGIGEAGFDFRAVFILSFWPLWAVGLARSLSNGFAAVGFGLSGKIMKRFSAQSVLMFEQLYTKTVDFVALFFPSSLSPALMSSTSLMYGPSTIAENSMLQREFSDKQRATMGSLNSLGKSVSLAISLMLLGWAADKTTPRTALIVAWVAGWTSVYLTKKYVDCCRIEKVA